MTSYFFKQFYSQFLIINLFVCIFTAQETLNIYFSICKRLLLVLYSHFQYNFNEPDHIQVEIFSIEIKERKKIMKHHKKNILLELLFILIAIGGIGYIALFINNQKNSTYESLPKTDQVILSELNALASSEAKTTMWKDYKISDKPVLALNGRFGKAYLINPYRNIKSVFAKEISLPENYTIKVYRISPLAPSLLQFITAGNFNTAKKNYSVYKNNVYFTKYDDSSIMLKHNSSHYSAFLTHESFHYYMQDNWSHSGRFDTSELTGENLSLLGEEYKILQKIYDTLDIASEAGTISEKITLQKLAKEYVDVTNRRFQAAPSYMKEESQAETEEGTATYVGMKAAKITGYDFRIMHFIDKENDRNFVVLPFDSIVPAIQSGTGDASIISTNMVYQSGALLCQLLDALEISDWQECLNNQTTEKPVTLYDLLSKYVDTL